MMDVEDGMLAVGCPRCGMSGPVSVDGDPDEARAGWIHLCGRACTGCRKGLIKRYTERVQELKDELAAALQEAEHGKGVEGRA